MQPKQTSRPRPASAQAAATVAEFEAQVAAASTPAQLRGKPSQL